MAFVAQRGARAQAFGSVAMDLGEVSVHHVIPFLFRGGLENRPALRAAAKREFILATASAPCYKAKSSQSPTFPGEAVMDYNGAPRSSGRDTYLTILLCGFVGIPLFVFLTIITGGLFLWMLIGAAGIGVLGAFHYLLWGRSFSQETAGEREEEELRGELETEGWPDDEPGRSRRL